MTLHLHNGRTHSCHHPYPHVVPLDELENKPSALHNTSFKKEQRRQMLAGDRPKECQYCWNVEDLDGFKKGEIISDRISKSSELWSEPYLNELATNPWDKDVNPSYVEVSFSNLCNFKCSYCSPVYSSKWNEEIETHGPYPTSAKFNDLAYFKSINEMPKNHKNSNPYVEAFWKWWPELISNLSVFRITGGEPLLNENTFKILDYLVEHPQPQLNLAFNTNGCAPEKLFDSFISKIKTLTVDKKIKSVQIYMSVDGYGPYAEYGRFGLSYQTWCKNLERLLDELPQVKITVMCTTNIFSVPDFIKFVKFIHELKKNHYRKRITLDTNILRFPHHQNLCILTDEHKTAFDESLSYFKTHQVDYEENNLLPGFYKFEVNRLERLVEYIKSGPHFNEGLNLETARADFYNFVNEHDRRRGTSFLDTFSDLKNFYDVCEKAHLSFVKK